MMYKLFFGAMYSATGPWKIVYIDRWSNQLPSAPAGQMSAVRLRLRPIKEWMTGLLGPRAMLGKGLLRPGRPGVCNRLGHTSPRCTADVSTIIISDELVYL